MRHSGRISELICLNNLISIPSVKNVILSDNQHVLKYSFYHLVITELVDVYHSMVIFNTVGLADAH